MAAVGYKALRPPRCPYPMHVVPEDAAWPAEGEWGRGLCALPPPETAAMAWLCAPCQFGLTRAEALGGHWVPPAVAHAACALAPQAVVLAACGGPVPDATAHAAAAAYGRLAVGAYAGRARALMRAKYGIPGDYGEDCLVHAFCEPCALAQEAGRAGEA